MTRPRMDASGGQADALEHLDPVSLAEAISKLPPNHALVVAARVGAEVADARWEHREAMRQASKDVSAGWRPPTDSVPYEELQRRRAEIPTPRQPVPDVELEAAFHAARAACAAATHEQPDDDDDAEEGDQRTAQADVLVDEA